MTEMSAPGQNRLRVLVVDDNRDAADSLCLLVGMWGHTARAAYEGAEALETARTFQPDCLFVDIRLPGIDGWAVLKALKADAGTSSIPVIVVSIVDERSRGVELGASAYLVKPVRREELLSALAAVGVHIAMHAGPGTEVD